MLDQFKNHITTTFPFLRQSKLLVACSGGVDSMVLAFLLKAMGFSFALAHCNYKLRGEASEGDEELVKKWAEDYGIPFYSKDCDLRESKGSIQLEARNLRYQWFEELVRLEGFDFVLTAHHANDTIETFFINLSRGTGLQGLTGIPEENKNILRPLLPFFKNDIVAFAKQEGIPWREDQTNLESKYVRNKIRNEIIPKLEGLHPNFLVNFQKTQEFLSSAQFIVDNHITQLKEKLFRPVGDSFCISVNALKQLPHLDTYLYFLFHEYGFTQWKDLTDLLDTLSGKEIRSATHRIVRNRKDLILAPVTQIIDKEFEINDLESFLQYPIQIKIESVDVMEPNKDNMICVDKEKLNYPLKLRKWKNGDYFYPLGMNGKKKLSKFFKDLKFSLIQKEEQWLLCSNEDIIWVLGQRMDKRFKVKPETKRIIKFTWIT